MCNLLKFFINNHRIISMMSFLLVGNMVTFGMEKIAEISAVPSNICLQQQILVPVDLMIHAAAQDDKVKNKLQNTCWMFKNGLSKYNPEFLAHPVFRASKKDIDHIACYAAWFNNSVLEQALHKNYSVSSLSFTVTTPSHYNMTGSQMYIGLNDLKKLRDQLNNNYFVVNTIDTLLQEVPIAFYCAVECNDYEALENIGLKIKQIPYEELYRINLHKSLLMQLIENNREEMFECIVKLDPFNALNSYGPSLNLPAAYHPPFLDFLCEAKNIPKDEKDPYIALYKQYGGKNLIELKKDIKREKAKGPKKQKKQNCVIS